MKILVAVEAGSVANPLGSYYIAAVVERGEVSRALLYVFTSTFVSLVAFYVGLRLSRLILS